MVLTPIRHIEVLPEHNGNLFFWFFENKHLADKSRTVIWLNGGPGCSSEDGALMEIGPYRLNEDGTLRLNDGAWTEFANVLFIDNPVGTGFSYVDTDSYVHELSDMANQLVTFLETWFATFPEYVKDDVGTFLCLLLTHTLTLWQVVSLRRVLCGPAHSVPCPRDPRPQRTERE